MSIEYNNRSLPKWAQKIEPIDEIEGKFIEALTITVEALQHFQFHSGRTVYQYEDESKEALRRIEELGK